MSKKFFCQFLILLLDKCFIPTKGLPIAIYTVDDVKKMKKIYVS